MGVSREEDCLVGACCLLLLLLGTFLECWRLLDCRCLLVVSPLFEERLSLLVEEASFLDDLRSFRLLLLAGLTGSSSTELLTTTGFEEYLEGLRIDFIAIFDA